MRTTLTLVGGLVILGLQVAAAAAAVVTLTASKDNTLYENATGAVSNGKGGSLFSGRTDDGALRRALLAFDVAGAIPPGSVIRSASLTMTVTRVPFRAVSSSFELRPVVADWGEGTSNAVANPGMGAAATPGDATWIHRFFNTDFWINAGGDFGATASAAQTLTGTGLYTWGSTPAMVADVQLWLNAPATNFGWLLLGNEAVDLTAKQLASRENPNSAAVPMLTVTFIAPAALPAASAWGMAVLVTVLLLIGVRRLRGIRSALSDT